MALSDDEQEIRDRLAHRLTSERRELDRLNAYFNGAQRLEQLGLAVPEDLSRFTVIVNYPRQVLKALAPRVRLEGFMLAGQPEADDELWRIWQASGMDEESQMGHLEALIARRCFICVGTNEADENTPLTTVESPLEMAVELDPRTRKERYGYRAYRRENEAAEDPEMETLYLPDVTIHLEQVKGKWVDVDRDEHGLGVPPVVMLANQPRLKNRYGVSELDDAITLTDAAMRNLTNTQLAAELLAGPMRYVLGATKGDFVDQNGKPVTAWEAYLGHFLALGNPEAKVGQLAGADLGNFTKVGEHYAQLIAGAYGLPLRYMGQSTTNPPSAEGIRADESRMIEWAESFHLFAGGAWERWARLCRRFVEGTWDPSLERMECLWRDPGTPTRAQAADAAVKLHAERILPLEAVWEDLGYSAERRKKLREQFEAEQADPLLSMLKQGPSPPQDTGQGSPAGQGQDVNDDEPAGAFLG